MKKIGLIGGMTPESTCYYYRKYIEISRKKFRKYEYPELLIYSINFRDFFMNPEGWEGRKRILINAAKALERAGAELIALTANTPHIVFDDIQKEISVPMVSIIDAVAEEILSHGLKKVLLLETKTTMSSGFYVNALKNKGLEVVVPNEEEQEELNRIIFEELAFENLKSKRWIIDLIERYAKEEGVEGVILGCTELPLAVKRGDVSIEVFDSAEIHIKKLIEVASQSI
ncbi:aspartate/glutamate racemase family protein [Pyrococcus furiosus DSM 3638]|uniref:Aspartate/glutamate racemase family protein n=2 Tax=Pyrococcus furiosus TaxID=2261 RepID=A0A5C0XPW5_PYRFU|nr:aspartate/glutamate racemase family protein [Pyrococcus furiosus]AFN04965.1 aspartate racemase [Pyrococcus furiosus COM1]QEK79296.1 aspartate/glutamate racemase family protein [Pyrococcus furiosus DSM 3638]